MGLFDGFKKDKAPKQSLPKRDTIEHGDIRTDMGIIRDVIEYDYGMVTGKVKSKQWGDNFKLVCDKKEQFLYAQKCLLYLDSMSSDMEGRLMTYLWRYYKDYEDFYKEDYGESAFLFENEILEHIRIGSVIVGDSCRQDRIEFHVEGSCDWEPEHGLEITISDGKILYVGPYEDYDPNTERLSYALEHYGYYDPDADPIMNYADKE